MPAPNLAAYSMTLTTRKPPPQMKPSRMLREMAFCSSRCAVWTARTTNHEPVISKKVFNAPALNTFLLIKIEHLDISSPGKGVGGKEHREDKHFRQDEKPDGK